MNQTKGQMRAEFESWYTRHFDLPADEFYETERDDWAWRSWQEAKSSAQPTVPAFNSVARRKLSALQEQGYSITGYAIERASSDGGKERGYIDCAGFVCWWPTAPQSIQNAPNVEKSHIQAQAPTELTAICEAYEQGYQHGTKSYDKSYMSLEDNPHESDGNQRAAWEMGFLQGGHDRLRHGLQRPSEVDQYLLQAIRELEHCQRHPYEHCQIYVDIVDRANKHAHAQKLTEFAEKSERHAKANPDDLVAQLIADNQKQAADEAVKQLDVPYDDEPQEKPNEERT